MKWKIGILSALLVLIVFTSGCVSTITRIKDVFKGGECAKIEKKVREEQGLDCTCFSADKLPKDLRNMTNVTGKCYCTCQVGKNKTVSIAIAETPGGRDVQVRK